MGKRMRVFLAFALVVSMMVVGVTSVGAATPVVYVDGDPGCGGNSPCYSTIQAGVDDVDDGGTVHVLPGTYQEQVVINKSLTIQGTGSPVVKAPASPNAFNFPESSYWWEPVLFAFGGSVDGSGNISGTGQVTVNISGLVVDGNDRVPTSGRRSAGILLRNVVGTVSGNTVQNMYIDSAETFGIVAYGDSNVTISGNTISGYARGGIGVNGDIGVHPAPHATVTNNTVTGPGLGVPVTWAPNGIQIGWGATGEIRGNTVSGNGWPGTEWTGSGILVFLSNGVIVEQNTVSSNETGIAIAGDMWGAYGSGTASGTIIRSNAVDGNTYGISIQDRSVDTLVEGNTITGSEYDGIDVCNFYGNPPTGTVINYNNIADNNTANDPASGGLWVALGVPSVNAENNWWGAANGPGGIGPGDGDPIIDENDPDVVDYDPWLGYPVGLWVEVPDGTFIPGDVVEVAVKMGTPGSILGGQFTLQYDSSKLTLNSVTPGPHFPTKWVDTSVANQVSAAFENLGLPFAGTDALAYLKFTIGASGTHNLDLIVGLFSLVPDSNPFIVTYLGNGTLTVVEAGSVSGKVILQGRDYAGHSTRNGGATVILSVAGGTTTSATPGGEFSFSSVRPGSYEAQARMDGYLTAVKPGINVVSGSNDIGTVKLLGGDATHDQMINIQDLAFMGARFNKPSGSWGGNDSWADINADNAINILDLTLAGSNFGKAAPQAWTA